MIFQILVFKTEINTKMEKDKIQKLLERYKILKLTEKEIERLNKLKIRRWNEIIFKPPTKESPS